MRISAVRFGRLVSEAGFNNKRAEVEVELEPGDSAADAFRKARQMVDLELGANDDAKVAAKLREMASNLEGPPF